MKRTLLKRIRTNSLIEFQQSAQEIRKILTDKSVVAFDGPLGAGKTEMVRAFCALEKAPGVSSPTFAIHQRYQGAIRAIDHLDLYRLKSEAELEGTGFWDFFSDESGWIFIEWSERMNLEQIPFDWDLFWVEIKKTSDSSRVIEIFKRD